MYLSFLILTKDKQIKISVEDKQENELKILKVNTYMTN